MGEKCRKCGEQVTAEDIFCARCGAPSSRLLPDGPPRPTKASPPVIPPPRATISPGQGAAGGRARARETPGLHPAMRSAARQEREPDLLPGYRAISGSAGLAPLVNTRLHLHMLRQAAMFACGWLFTQTLVAIVAGVAVAAGASLAGVLSLWAVCAALTGLVLAVAFWLLPVPAPVAQWSLLVQHGAAAAQPALAYITKALRDRGTPLDSAGLRSPGQGQRDYLELRHGRFTGCVSCFAHGRDLYVGWTFWLHLSPLRLLLLSVAGKAPNMSGRRSGIEQMLRYETASATVAAVHGAVLEAIDTATAELDPAGRRLLRGDRREFKFG